MPNLKTILPASLAIALSLMTAWAASPVVSNVRASQRPGTKLVDIFYDVADADGGTVTVEVNVSGDGGLSYLIPATTFTGAVGSGVTLGSNRQIVWNAGADWTGNFVPTTKIRVTAHDGASVPAPSGMAYIPGGPFQMGDNLDGLADAPVHTVYVTAFFIDKYEVTKDLYTSIQGWAISHGYSLGGGSADGSFHPIQSISWYDAIKWCNARSEQAGLTPCYYTDVAQTVVYRTGLTSIENTMVKWTANGYRLPTEAEWAKAARGGVQGNRYPGGDTISYSNANYAGHPTYAGANPDTAPVGQFAGNGFGLFDMAGNISELCWDWYGTYEFGVNDPKGPVLSSYRVFRGGSWASSASDCRVAFRGSTEPNNSYINVGFRSVRR